MYQWQGADYPGAMASNVFLSGLLLELITFEILAAERLRLMAFDNRLIIDCVANVVNTYMAIFYK